MNPWSELSGAVGCAIPAVVAEALSGSGRFARERLLDPEEGVLTALDQMAFAAHLPPTGLLPFSFVDEASYACAVCVPSNVLPDGAAVGAVVRVFITDVARHHQAALLDTDVGAYLQSLDAQLEHREAGLRSIERVAQRYHENFTAEGKTPKAKDRRPVRLACQNVVMGVAVFRHDRASDSLVVSDWQTTEAPHVGTHEATRAMAALMLSDAFRSGGTMEIRFDQHPERRVPGMLRSFARTRGVEVGEVDRRSIVPVEARELYVEVAGIPAPMRASVRELCERSGLSPERICYLVASGVWLPVELDFLLRSTDAVGAIVVGGGSPLDRIAHQRLLIACRAAILIGLAYKRRTAAGDSEEDTALEDSRHDVDWSVHGPGVRMSVSRRGGAPSEVVELVPVPVGHPDLFVTPLAEGARFVAPFDVEVEGGDLDVERVPLTVAEIDAIAEKRLRAARVGRR